jgi:hypothetical protein
MRSVLIAIHNRETRESLQRELEDAGYITYTAGKATTSLMVLHMCPEELLVLLDAQLPAEGAAERMLLRLGRGGAVARHRYILCASDPLERISPRLAQLAYALDLPFLRMPFDQRTLRHVLEYGTLPQTGTHRISGAPR